MIVLKNAIQQFNFFELISPDKIIGLAGYHMVRLDFDSKS